METPENKNTWIVIPAFNEDSSILPVLASLRPAGYSVVVVDDGSNDNLSVILEGQNVHFCRHLINLGQGAALQTGISYALENGAKFIVTFDADGQHLASEIPRLLEPIVNGQCEIALGSRFMEGARVQNIPRKKLVTLKLAILFTRLTTGLALTDTHNGFRAMSEAAARKLTITQNRMAHASQILKIISEKKMRYKEIPVTIVYTDYSMAKGQRVSNALNIVWDSLAEYIR